MNVFYSGFRLFWTILPVKSHFHIKHPHFYHFFFKHFGSNANPKPQYIVSKQLSGHMMLQSHVLLLFYPIFHEKTTFSP